MKTTSFVVLGIASLAIAVIAFAKATNQQPDYEQKYALLQRKVESALRGKTFAEGAQMTAYRLVPATERSVRADLAALASRLASRISGSGTKLREVTAPKLGKRRDHLLWKYRDTLKVRGFVNSGFLEVVNMDKVFAGDCADLSDERVRAIAANHIRSANVISLASREQLVPVRVTSAWSQAVQAVAGKPTTKRSKRQLNNRIVVFSRKSSGIPVIGPGSRCVVFLTGQGQLAGLFKNWRSVDYGHPIRVHAVGERQLTSMFMKRLRNQFGKHPPSPNELQIERVEAGYFADGKHREQTYLQLAYAVFYVVTSKTDEGPIRSAYAFLALAQTQALEPLAVLPASEQKATTPRRNLKAKGADDR